MSVAPTDICENKHGGNLFSIAAFDLVLATLPDARAKVLDRIHAAGTHGATCAEVAEAMRLEMHQVSGRLSELKRDGLIVPAMDSEGKPIRRKSGKGGYGQVFHAA